MVCKLFQNKNWNNLEENYAVDLEKKLNAAEKDHARTQSFILQKKHRNECKTCIDGLVTHIDTLFLVDLDYKAVGGDEH